MVSMGLSSTSSRVVRGPKAKLFLYICAVLIITGLIACYNSTLSQLDDAKKSNMACHREQENLSTQLQVISDYKQKLEKSLKNEQAEHQQSKSKWEVKMNDEKSKVQKLTDDALLKYNSLQQHYKLLQTEFDDFKDESSKVQKEQLEEINSLQSKLNEAEEELKKVKIAKENFKNQLTEVEFENIQLKNNLEKAGESKSQQTIKMYLDEFQVLYGKYEKLREKCNEPPDEVKPLNVFESANKPSEKSVQNLPLLKMAENPSSSTKAVPKMSPSEGVLNGARPMNAPTVTPATAKKEVNLKPPQGVVEAPENRENQNEQPQLNVEKKMEKLDEAEKDNLAQEVFDNNEGLGFVENALKPGLSNELNQKGINIDSKKHDDQDYKDIQREEEGGDDEADEYGQPRGGEAAVRN